MGKVRETDEEIKSRTELFRRVDERIAKMPSSEDIAKTEHEARELAVQKIIEREKCSVRFAREYVTKLSKQEIAELIGWPAPGGAYSSW